MGVIITCGIHFLVLGIWMVFISCSLGQLFSRERFVHYEQISKVNIERFRSSQSPEVQRQKVGNINSSKFYYTGLRYQRFCDHSRNFALVNFEFWRICKKFLSELTK